MSTSPRPDPNADPPGLEDDPEGARVVSEELRLLGTVRTTLQAAEARLAEPTGGDDARLLELREEVATAKPEDLPSLFEQMHHIGALRAQRGRGQNAGVDRASPYFGHLRLEEGGRRRDVLVGARSYVEPGAGVRIVDWRNAPVSRIFYRYGEGDDYEEQLGGRLVEGVVAARRSVAIVKGELLRVASPQGTFTRSADGRWQRMKEQAVKLMTERRYGGTSKPPVAASPGVDGPRLGVGADGQLRTDKMLPAIAAMLDPAQFDLIARPGAGLVAIQGSAGSGKTTVGLHRVAYLAFQDPQRFRADRMLVVVPHDALVHYVGRVLPTLGVEGVPVTTFARWGSRVLAGLFPRLTTAIHEDTPPVVSRAKSHPAMLGGIERLVAKVNARLDARMQTAMERWPAGADVIAAWSATAKLGAKGHGLDKTVAPDARVTALAQWLAGKRVLEGTAPAAELPEVTKSALEKLGHELRTDTRAVTGLWDELLTDRQGLAETFAGAPGLGPGQLDQVYEWTVRQARVRGEGERDGEHASIDAEDLALLLRTYQKLRGGLVDEESKPIRFNHLFVDEVQDASPVELRVLLDLAGAEQSITLAGDLAQRMREEDGSEFDWQRLLRDLGVPHTQIEPLKVSYRSTAEITTFARGVLGPYAHDAEPIATRHGPPVELFSFASPGEAVAFLADALRQLAREEPYANVALLARYSAQADVYFEGLSRAEVPNVRRVRALDFSWEPGFDVTDVRQTKGLEFDEVVLLETSVSSYPDNAAARHALYVGATRAAHQLWCLTTEAASPLVAAGLELTTAAEA